MTLLGQIDIIVDKAFALYMADPGLVIGIHMVLKVLPKIIPDHHLV